LLQAATAGIDRLNAKYPLTGSTRFYLFIDRANGTPVNWYGWASNASAANSAI